MPNGVELISLAPKIANLLLRPDVFRGCQTSYQRGLSPKEVAESCLDARCNIDILLFWDGAVKALSEYGVDISRERFKDYRDGFGLGAVLFEQVFKMMIHPPVAKSLEDWM